MSKNRRSERLPLIPVFIFAFGFTLAITPAPVEAQSALWQPDKNVELIVGTTPGGGFDRTARSIQRIWQDRKIVDVVVSVVNKPGGGNAVAWTYLNQHAKDGHYLSISSPNLLTNHITGKSSLSHADVTPIAHLFDEYISFVVNVDSPLGTGKDVVARLKKDPGSLSLALATALGNANHIAIGMVAKAAGIDVKKLKVVVFNSASEAIVALLGGHVDVVATPPSNAAPQMKAGKVRIIAVCSPQRLGVPLSSVPTWKEQGIDAVFANGRGVIGPKGLAPALVAYWEKAFAKLNATNEWKEFVDGTVGTRNYMNSGESRVYLEAQYRDLKSLLSDLGLAKR